MKLSDIIGRFNDLKIHADRVATDDYYEIVFYSKDTAVWDKAITDALGPAVKPSKIKPTKEDLRITDAYGGIQAGQTLFKKDFEGHSIIAMFWPWQDQAHTTLKMALLNNSR